MPKIVSEAMKLVEEIMQKPTEQEITDLIESCRQNPTRCLTARRLATQNDVLRDNLVIARNNSLIDAKGEPAKFVPDDHGGHIVFAGKIWRPVEE